MKNQEYALLFVVSFVAFYAMLAVLSPVITDQSGAPVIGGIGTTGTGTGSGECGGDVKLSFFPESVELGARMSAIISGMENCNAKVVFVRQQIDNDQELKCSCVVATGNGCGCSFEVPLNSCAFNNYYAQVDMNGNGDYNDAGETSTTKAPVSNCPVI